MAMGILVALPLASILRFIISYPRFKKKHMRVHIMQEFNQCRVQKWFINSLLRNAHVLLKTRFGVNEETQSGASKES